LLRALLKIRESIRTCEAGKQKVFVIRGLERACIAGAQNRFRDLGGHFKTGQ
jgi:hypothetical protein